MKKIIPNAFRLGCCLLETTEEEIISKYQKRTLCHKRYALIKYFKEELNLYTDELKEVFHRKHEVIYRTLNKANLNENYYNSFKKEMNYYLNP